MQNNELRAKALTPVLRHDLTGCARSAHQAVDMLERLSSTDTVDSDARILCARLPRQAGHAA